MKHHFFFLQHYAQINKNFRRFASGLIYSGFSFKLLFYEKNSQVLHFKMCVGYSFFKK